jgi:hypothetical protein
MIKQLIEKIESVLGRFSIPWVNCFVYTLYEDLLLLSSCDENEKDDLYRDINYTIYKYFNNAKKKHILEDKDTYSTWERYLIIRSATTIINRVCVTYDYTASSS